SACLLAAALGMAQQKSDLKGDYAGSLGPYHVRLHLIAGQDGTLTGTVDSMDQGLSGMQCTDIHVNGQTLSFTVPVVHGTWVGFIGDNGASLSGMWNQGTSMPLNFTRVQKTSDSRGDPPSPQAVAAPPAPHILDVLGSGEFNQDGFKFVKQNSFVHVYATV